MPKKVGGCRVVCVVEVVGFKQLFTGLLMS